MIQNILFIKHPTEERFDPVIARYYPDNKYSSKEFKELVPSGAERMKIMEIIQNEQDATNEAKGTKCN